MTNLKPAQVSEILNISVKTLQRWDRDGILIAKRTPTDRRYYTDDQIEEFNKTGSENKKDSMGLVDRGFKLILNYDSEKEEFERLTKDIPKVYLVSSSDDSHAEDLDALYEAVFSEYNTEYDLCGFNISEVLIYNVMMDYIIEEYENGNENAGDLMYPLFREHQLALENGLKQSKVQKLVKKYIIDLLSEDE